MLAWSPEKDQTAANVALIGPYPCDGRAMLAVERFDANRRRAKFAEGAAASSLSDLART